MVPLSPHLNPHNLPPSPSSRVCVPTPVISVSKDLPVTLSPPPPRIPIPSSPAYSCVPTPVISVIYDHLSLSPPQLTHPPLSRLCLTFFPTTFLPLHPHPPPSSTSSQPHIPPPSACVPTPVISSSPRHSLHTSTPTSSQILPHPPPPFCMCPQPR